MDKKHDIIEIAGDLRHETEKAFLLFDGKKEVWVPFPGMIVLFSECHSLR